MTDSIETSDREAEEPRMLRLPVVEMAAEPAPPPVAAGYEPHPVGTGERIRFLERVNAELVEASTELKRFYAHIWDRVDGCIVLMPGSVDAFESAFEKFCAALTSATKEQQK